MTPAAITLAATRRALTETLQRAGIDTAEADARLLIAAALGISRTEMTVNGDRPVTVAQRQAIDALAARRLRHEPVARILGRKEFWSLPLDVTPAVLVPRPETETVVEAALDVIVRDGLKREALRILDIGTGSGALLLALLSELPHAQGVGTDISEAALVVASGNAERNGLAARCRFVACSIADGVRGPFDLIVSNPPYIARAEIAGLEPEVRDYDPMLALDGGNDGLDAYRAIAVAAPGLLARGGRLIVELGAGQEQAVRALWAQTGLEPSGIRTDLAGIARALRAELRP